ELLASFVVMVVRLEDQIDLLVQQEIQDVRPGLARVFAHTDARLMHRSDDPRDVRRMSGVDRVSGPVVIRLVDVVIVVRRVVEDQVGRNQDEPGEWIRRWEVEIVLPPIVAGGRESQTPGWGLSRTDERRGKGGEEQCRSGDYAYQES